MAFAIPDESHSSSSTTTAAATEVVASMCTSSSSAAAVPHPDVVSPSNMEATVTTTEIGTTSITYRPPPRFSSYSNQDEYPPCTHCLHPTSLHLDRSQGDVVCTNCGIVADEKYCDTSAEWRDFNDVEDIIKNKPSAIRSGCVPVNEELYIGGLQPTTLSATPFGGTTTCESFASSGNNNGGAVIAAKEYKIRRRLMGTNRKLDKMMEKMYEKRMEESKTARDVMKRRRERKNGIIKVQPKEEEKEEEKMASEKWSLQRAFLLHGSIDEYMNRYHPSGKTSSSTVHKDVMNEKELLFSKLDKKSIHASQTLYNAIQALHTCITKLSLPDLILRNVESSLSQYIKQKNGFFVAGVSLSSHKKKKHHRESKVEEKERLAKQKMENEYMMSMSLCAAFVYLNCKQLGWGRTLMEVCDSFDHDDDDDDDDDENESVTKKDKKKKKKQKLVIKPKHCCRAMNEIKQIFPDFFKNGSTAVAATTSTESATGGASTPMTQNESTPSPPPTVSSSSSFTPPPQNPSPTTINNTASLAIVNMTSHSLRKLTLPPITQNLITILTSHAVQEQRNKGIDSGIKTSVIIGGMTYLICSAGVAMSQLAQQAASALTQHQNGKKKRSGCNEDLRDKKRVKREETDKTSTVSKVSVKQEETTTDYDEDMLPPLLAQPTIDDLDIITSTTTTSMSHDDESPNIDSTSTTSKSTAALEEEEQQDQLHAWEAWKNLNISSSSSSSTSTSWHRTIPIIAKRLQISKNALMDYYRKSIYPRRLELLSVLSKYESGSNDDDGKGGEWIEIRKSIVAAVPLMTLPK